MIGKIKQIVQNNRESFGKDIDVSGLRVSKFFHGKPESNRKILFYISVSTKPLAIIKLARDKEFNSIISREVAGLQSSLVYGISPKLYFFGSDEGRNYMCEEIVSGLPVGRSHEEELLPFVLKLTEKAIKKSEVTVGRILELFSHLPLAGYKEFDDIWKELKLRSSEKVWIAAGHGDVTYKNILMKENKEPILIDFENFLLRPIWGIDFVHYVSRVIYGGNTHHDVTHALKYFNDGVKKYDTKILKLNERQLENIFLLDWLFDAFQKDYNHMYKDIIPLMEKIWSL